MVCSVCSTVNPDGAVECAACKTPLETILGEQPTNPMGVQDPENAATVAMENWTTPSAMGTTTLAEGTVLGGRYQLLKLLGEGGMGAVYKALDREVDRVVALKVIRPQFASEPAILKRFKQELVLARQITHRNVIRIFDLGVAEGVRFITMEYVVGRELSEILTERDKLEPAMAVSYIRQILEGLEAAHNEGVVHRDLKPSNVMIDDQGRARIMDFGIARSASASNMTRTGALMGTPVYMSPEQAKGVTVDNRSDLYTVGIIFYEMLTGTVPFKADNVMTMLLMRCQEKPKPPIEVDSSVPPTLSEIVLKALATEPADRYQNAREMLSDLEMYQAGAAFAPMSRVAPRTLSKTTPPGPSRARRILNMSILILGTISMVVAGYLGLKTYKSPKTNAPAKSVTVLVADFDNTTSESIFDGTLEPVFMTGMEGASFVSSFNRATAHSLAQELAPGSTKLNEAMARTIATRQGINVVITGLVARHGDGYRVTVNAIDGLTGKTMVSRDSAEAPKDKVLTETAKLVPALRRAVGDVTPEAQLAATGETFTSTSLDAMHDYGAAQQQQWAGKFEEAAKLYLKAASADPKFGRAYAGLAAMNRNLGRSAEADKYYKLALEQVDRMTDREKFRTRGGYFLYLHDPKAIEEYTSLVKQFPADTAGQANLAVAYCYARDMAKAMEEARKSVELEPNNTLRKSNQAEYALYASDSAEAIRVARIALGQNPKYEKSYIVVALSQMLDGQVDAATKTYQQLQGVSPLGASMAATGLADIAMYQGKFSEAASILEHEVEADAKNPRSDWAIVKLLIQAESEMAQKRATKAAAYAEKALASSDSDAVLFTAAEILIQAGQQDKARRLAAQLGQRLTPEPRAYAKVILAELQLAQQKPADALETLNDAQKLSDTWIGHFVLGKVYLEAKAFPQADSEFDLCWKRRGEATALFLDEIPTVRYLPAVQYYDGRASEGLKSPKASQYYKAFLAIKASSQDDPLVTDARRRLESPPK